jgi:filamentous hemagglutinin family protein
MQSSLNHIYRLVWNAAQCRFVPVPETARGRGKGGRSASRAAAAALATVAMAATSLSPAWAQLPTGGDVVGGSGSIAAQGNTMTVTQTTDRMAANWQTFSIGKDHTVNFVQPSSSSVALNRVLGSDVSVIQGAINANGQVFLVNPNGVLFTKDAHVDVGSLVASTLNISTTDFMAGNYRFEGASSSAIVNQGRITAHGNGAGGGTVALIAAKITNEGSISAHAGNVLMGAGSKVLLDLGGPVKIQVEQGAIDALIEQGGAIKADGGLVYLSAKAAGDLVSTVINHTGMTEAQTLATGETGQIYLMGGMQKDRIEVAGKLDASAPKGGDGGFIETSAANVQIQPGLVVTTKAENGQTGEWLIDPYDFVVSSSGGNITGAALGGLLANNNITIQTANPEPTSSGTVLVGSTGANGDIFVNDSVAWSTDRTLTLNAWRNIEINAPITATHANGGLSLIYGQWSADGTSGGVTATYTINAPISLKNSGSATGINGAAQTNFSTKLGFNGTARNFTTISTREALQAINSGLSGSYALGSNIDLSGVTWTTIGNVANQFTGNFDGLGNTISSLTVTVSLANQGLFGYANGARIKNIGVTDVNITSSNDYVGGLVGFILNGTIENAFVTGKVSGTGTGRYIGGLAGGANSTTISQSSSHASVNNSSANWTGGLVGILGGESRVNSSYSTGNVTSDGNYVGGLVGNVGLVGVVGKSVINDSYATGSVTGTNFVGGLVGALVAHSGSVEINNAYATGSVSGSSDVGGLVGLVATYTSHIAKINNSFWDVNTSGIGVSGNNNFGATGKTTAQMKDAATFAAWDQTGTIWSFPAAGRGAEVAGYEYAKAGLPYLTNVTRVEDRDGSGDPIILFAGGWGGLTDAQQTGADGSAYTISNWNQLQNINLVVNQGFDFALLNDLSSSTEGYADQVKAGETLANNGTGWRPIGDNSTNSDDSRFIGRFDGQDHSISGLVVHAGINESKTTGLFGYAQGSSQAVELSNIRLINVDISGSRYLGALLGFGRGGVRIENASSTGSVAGVSLFEGGIGGLVGLVEGSAANPSAQGLIKDSWSSATVTGVTDVGGLVGRTLNTSITGSYATGDVSGATYVGGLVGAFYDYTASPSYVGFSDNHATGAVGSVAHSNYGFIGGLIGYLHSGKVVRSWAGGHVDVTNDTTVASGVGGLIGASDNPFDAKSAQVLQSYATGNVSTTGSWDNVGGLIGLMQKTLALDVYASGDVITGADSRRIGGLVGSFSNQSRLTSAYAVGAVQAGPDSQDVGGLIGNGGSITTISNSYWDIETSGLSTSGGGLGKTTAQMYDSATYTTGSGAWDANVWSFFEGRGAAVEGYEIQKGLPYLTGVTRVQDRVFEEPETLFAGGWGGLTDAQQTGADESAYTITNWTQLQNINLVANKGFDFELSNDLDSSIDGYADQVKAGETLANNGTGWTPIGNANNPFTGRFNGQDHTISDLVILAGVDIEKRTGLFGYAESGSQVVELTNIHLVNVDISGSRYLGALLGFGKGEIRIENATSTGSVTGLSFLNGGVGGLVGLIERTNNNLVSAKGGEIKDSSSSATVKGVTDVGGLIGQAHNTSITGSHASGAVSGARNAGGLVGAFYDYRSSGASLFSDNHATGAVGLSVAPVNYENFGGLIGYMQGADVERSWALGDVDISNGTKLVRGVGGLIGKTIQSNASKDPRVLQSYATGDVTTGKGDSVGGLIGWLQTTGVSNVYASGDVRTGDESNGVGGLVGNLHGNSFSNSITRSYSVGLVQAGERSFRVGGLLGLNGRGQQGTGVTSSYWNTETSGQTTSEGGLGKTTAEMKDIALYVGWSIEEVQGLDEGEGYPILAMGETGPVWKINSLVTPAPNEPAPNEPAPNEPAPNEPAPNEPAPNEPAPNEPAPNEPVPNEPAPNEPAPNEPALLAPTPNDGAKQAIQSVQSALNSAVIGSQSTSGLAGNTGLSSNNLLSAGSTGSGIQSLNTPAASVAANVGGGSAVPAAPASISVSGGLAFVSLAAEPSDTSEGAASPAQTAALSNDAAGRDLSGFMRVFVVQGGINLPEQASSTADQNTGGNQ